MKKMSYFIDLIKSRYIFIYILIILFLNIWIYIVVNNITTNLFPDSVIRMRFNMFQGVTIINQSSALNIYFLMGIAFSFINIILSIIVKIKVFVNKTSQHFILNWIFITNILILLVLRYYLNIVTIINS